MVKKILIIDDDFDILEPLSILLEEEGFLVKTMLKVEKSYRYIIAFKPDLILLDVLMSGNDGRTICTTLKNNAAVRHIPIIMMSAHPSAEKDSRLCGADEFIAKPFETEEIIQKVKEFI